MNPMDAAWTVLKADPNVRMRANSPTALGRASKTMHPAIAGMMQGIGDKRKEPIPKDMVSLQGRKTVSGSGHTYPYEFMDTRHVPASPTQALGEPESTPGRSVSERGIRPDGPLIPDEVVQSLRQDPSQNENFMRVFNEHMARQGRMGNPDGVQMIPDMMGQMGQTSPAPPPADPEFMARIKADEEETKQRKTEREERKR